MTAKRYAVANASGKIINHILVDDPLPKGYWPGYGAYLLPLEPVSMTKGGGGLDCYKFTFTAMPQIGDTVDMATGVVTKFVPVNYVDKDGVTVSPAPDVKLIKDIQPKSEGTVTVK